jgi:hypothetical protein
MMWTIIKFDSDPTQLWWILKFQCDKYLLGDIRMLESEWYLQLCQLVHTGQRKDKCVKGRSGVRIWNIFAALPMQVYVGNQFNHLIWSIHILRNYQ